MTAAPILLFVGLFGAPPDDEASREAEMFGEVETSSVASVSTSSVATSSVAGERPPTPPPPSREVTLPRDIQTEFAARAEAANDKLAIGGQLYLRLAYAIKDPAKSTTHTKLDNLNDLPSVSSPNLVDVYLDVRPTDRLRGFALGRLTFDPTVRAASATALAMQAEAPVIGLPPCDGPGTLVSLIPARSSINAYLDQLWLNFDIERTVFVTLGRQHVKWGTGRLWNPTDFLNQTARDPLALFDERLGVTLARVHFPIESLGWNFYAVGLFDAADEPERIGGAVRGEFVYEETEVSISAALRKDRPARFGLDFSSGVWIFDFHGEAAFTYNLKDPFYRGRYSPAELIFPEAYTRKDEVIVQLLFGGDTAWKYNDEDYAIFGFEYFFNDLGYDDSKYYTYLIGLGRYQPFYVGKHYAGLYAFLQKPGSWNNTTFSLSVLGNLSDKTFVGRLDYVVTVLTYLEISASGSLFFGENGEFHFAVDIPAALPDNDIEQNPIRCGIVEPSRRFEVALAARLKM